MRQPYTLTVTTDDGAVVSFQDVEGLGPTYWDHLPPDARDFLAWPIDESAYIASAMVITLESGEDRKRLYAFGHRGPTGVTSGAALPIGDDIILIISNQVARLNVASWQIAWHIEADWFTCFHIYPDPDDASAVIIHVYTINTATRHMTVEKPDADAATSES